MDIALWLVIGGLVLLLVVVIGWVIAVYNRMVRKKNAVEEGWKNIHVQERERLDTISQIVETVKGYQKHESEVFNNFAAARGAFDRAANSADPQKMAQADEAMDNAMLSIRAVGEAYPELKADKNFMHLQETVTSVEGKIAASRRFYNGAVQDFNETRQVFPNNIVVGMFNFGGDREYFELNEEEARQAPQIFF